MTKSGELETDITTGAGPESWLSLMARMATVVEGLINPRQTEISEEIVKIMDLKLSPCTSQVAAATEAVAMAEGAETPEAEIAIRVTAAVAEVATVIQATIPEEEEIVVVMAAAVAAFKAAADLKFLQWLRGRLVSSSQTTSNSKTNSPIIGSTFIRLISASMIETLTQDKVALDQRPQI
jgi:hypothetical protein